MASCSNEGCMVLFCIPLYIFKVSVTMHQTLYRKWRPSTFDEVSGQDHVTSVLKYEIANNKTTHAYLFCGSRGTGKTSCAKIFAKAINCLSPRDGNPCGECEACLAVKNETTTDILEMDAASNNGVDYIRDIRDAVVYAPAMLKNRVYIIDEVHMLSQSAFNALLKTLEEPPERVVFILATTEVNKLPVTVVSRCQRFDFRRLSITDISARLSHIADAENISLDERAARLIGKLARGGMRDAISLLELCAGENKPVDIARVNEAAGVCPRDTVEKVIAAVMHGDRGIIFDEIAKIYASSLDIVTFWQDLIEYLRDLMVVKTSAGAASYLELTDDEIASLRDISDGYSFDRIAACARALDDTLTNLQKGTFDNRILAEMTLIKLSSQRYGDTPDALAARIGELEMRLAALENGLVTPSVAPKEKKAVPAKEAPLKEEKTEEPKAVAKKADEAVNTDIIDNWIEVIDRVCRIDMSAGAFLSGSRAVRDSAGKRLIVRVADDFTVSMLDTEENKAILSRAASEIDRQNAGLRIEIEKSAVKKAGDNPLDDLLN